MTRQSGIRALVAAGLVVVFGVLGVAAKVGRDTSQYLQTVSTQRNWDSLGQGTEGMKADASGDADDALAIAGQASPSSSK